MFIAKAIANQSKLGGSETKPRYTLRSYGAVHVSRRVSINISSLRDSFVQETCSKNKKSDLSYTESPYRLCSAGGQGPFDRILLD